MDEDQVVEGFLYKDKHSKFDGEIVRILSRVDDPAVLEGFGAAFFVRFDSGEVGIALAQTLSPWFQV